MKIGQRLFLAVLPGIIGVLAVAALAYWGQRGHQVPGLILAAAVLSAVVSLAVAWVNTRSVARRIEQLAGSSGSAAAGSAPARDELDAIEHAVGTLSSAITAAERDSARIRQAADERVHEYAALLAGAAAAVQARLDEVRMPLHILLENHFGDLNENQEEMLGAARAAAETADAELRRLREVAATVGLPAS